VHAVIDKYAERGLRSLAVAYQVISLPAPIPSLPKTKTQKKEKTRGELQLVE